MCMEDQISSEVKNEDSISISKSLLKKIIIAGIIGAILSAFFVGYFVGINNVEPEKIFIQNAEDILDTTENKPVPKPEIIFISLDDDPVLGNPDAPLTIVEFSDFQCPFCAKFHTQTLPLIRDNYIKTGKVKFVYRDFPISAIHPNALPAALASECADEQGKFWQYHDMIFENQRNWQDLDLVQSTSTFKKYAVSLGLDSSKFDSCLDSGKYVDEIQNDLDDGRAYGVTGTPGFFVGNEKIGYTKVIGAQPFDAFQKILDAQLNR